VHQLGRLGGRSRCEVFRLHQSDAQPSGGSVEGHPAPGHPAADDEHVEDPARQLLERTPAVEWRRARHCGHATERRPAFRCAGHIWPAVRGPLGPIRTAWRNVSMRVTHRRAGGGRSAEAAPAGPAGVGAEPILVSNTAIGCIKDQNPTASSVALSKSRRRAGSAARRPTRRRRLLCNRRLTRRTFEPPGWGQSHFGLEYIYRM
jgi:hypothetical protein